MRVRRRVSRGTRRGQRNCWLSRTVAIVVFLGCFPLLTTPVRSQEPASESRSSLLGKFSGLGEFQFGQDSAPITITTEGGASRGIRLIGEQKIVVKRRTKIAYRDYSVEADRAVLDWAIQEVEAEGNVTFKGPGIDIRANSVRYNFRLDEGVAYGIEGRHEQIHFRVERDEVLEGPAFRRISEDQALIQGMMYTACDFPVPHYSVHGSEVILLLGERIFVRDAVLEVWGVPVMYLPAYTRSLQEPSPWSFEGGYTESLGVYLRVGYDYRHKVEVPDYFNPSEYRVRSFGQARVNFDTFTKRGFGLGTTYRYKIDYGRHRGSFSAYGIRDEERDVLDEDAPPKRGAIQWSNQSILSENLLFQSDIDMISDPDLYFDVLDTFTDEEVGRRPERRMRFALTYAREYYVARVMADLRDRVARDAFHDYSDPISNNLDYDPDPEGLVDEDEEGVSGRRYGSVSRKLPQLDLSTAYLKVFELPFYYVEDFHAFHALDKGLNPIADEDDSWVDGVDWYHAMMNRIRLSNRVTWTNQLGVGAAYFDRQDEQLNLDLPYGATFPFILDDITLVDRDTWLTGERERSYRDVENGHVYYDYESRMNARFTNTLEGYLKYTYRGGTDDSLGEFYRRIGDRTAQTDIYRFPVRTNMLEGFLNHFLLYPNLNTYLRGGYNLHSEGDTAPYDLLNYAGAGSSYTNDTRELTVSAGLDLQERQIRDLSDINEFQQSTLVYSGQVQYIPRHHRWWARLGVFAVQMLDNDPLSAPPRVRDRFDEDRTEVAISPLVGRRLGPKYTAEIASTYNTRIDDWKSAHMILKRDLHDLEAAVQVGFRRIEEVNNDNVRVQRENEIRFSIRMKMPGSPDATQQTSTIRTLTDRGLEAEFAN